VHGAVGVVRQAFTASGLHGHGERDHTVVLQPRLCDDDSQLLQDQHIRANYDSLLFEAAGARIQNSSFPPSRRKTSMTQTDVT